MSVDANQVAEIENFAVDLRRVADDGDLAGDMWAWDEIEEAEPKQVVPRLLDY